jgi:predicted dehydrogenase
MTKLRMGLVGCGLRGVFDPQSVARTIQSLDVAELVAIADSDAERARAAAEHLGLGDNHSDLAGLLRRDDVDAVYVVTPNPVHAPNGIAVLEAGKHLMLVKPMGMTLDECDRVLAAHRRSGRTLMIDSQLPFGPIARRAKELIAAGAIGRPVTTWDIQGRGKYRSGLSEWRFGQAGGIFFETLIHTLLFHRWLFDRPTARRVWAWGDRTVFQDYAYPDVVWAHVELDGPISAVLGENHLMDQFFSSRVVVGTEDTLYLERARLLLGGKSKPAEVVFETDQTPRSGLAHSISHFVDCVQNNRQPELTGDDGRAATEIALAANRAMEIGQPLTLPLVPVAR